MAVLVIQHGRFYEPPMTANCRNCRCIFSYDAVDVKPVPVGGDYDVDNAVECPECGWNVYTEDPNGS